MSGEGVAAAAAAAAAPPPPSRPPRDAYVTLVMCGDSYCAGAAVLAWSLRRCGATAEGQHLVCMVSEDVSAGARERLARVFDAVVEVPYVSAQALHQRYKRFEKMYQWINLSFTKINVLTLTQYRKVLLMDADMIARSSPAELFQLSAPAGICSSLALRDDEFHGQKLDEQTVEASLQQWGIRGCLYLFRPDKNAFDALRNHLLELERQGQGYGDVTQYCGPDERLITRFYRRFWTHIHHKFGARSWNWHEQCGDAEPVLLHFVSEKPWVSTEQWPDFELWDEVAQDLLREHPCMALWFPRRVQPPSPGQRQQQQEQEHEEKGSNKRSAGDRDEQEKEGEEGVPPKKRAEVAPPPPPLSPPPAAASTTET